MEPARFTLVGLLAATLLAGCYADEAPDSQPTTTSIWDDEEVSFFEGQSFDFSLEGEGTWTVRYDTRGLAGDSYTACIIHAPEFQRWVDDVTPDDAFGEACRGPVSFARATATLAAGDWSLALYCWNEEDDCHVTVTITAEG
ncbi:MAG TPA: hypothetical protein VI796_00385 [Candidatus Thermoplasmatota archaeon]|nr:hypothetical protein [Candidatus Thermoplasmatota archaeon]